MAAGKINLQANDTRIYEITAEDGAGSNVAITLPKEGGMLTVDAEVVHKTGDETIAGVKTLSNNLVFASGAKIQGNFSNPTAANGTSLQTNILNDNTLITAAPNGTASMSAFVAFGSSDIVNSHFVQMAARADLVTIDSTKTGTGLYKPLKLGIGGSYSLTLDTSGNTLVTGYGAFGYGTGAGGTVTQLTSKSTAVTLNKPTGIITMNNASLAAGAFVEFSLNNSLIASSDNVLITFSGVQSNQYSYIAKCVNGVAYIIIKNESSGSLSESVQISFVLIKGAIA